MTSAKYIGMDVHKESISIAVRNAAGKIVMECVIETKASMILQFIDGLRVWTLGNVSRFQNTSNVEKSQGTPRIRCAPLLRGASSEVHFAEIRQPSRHCRAWCWVAVASVSERCSR